VVARSWQASRAEGRSGAKHSSVATSSGEGGGRFGYASGLISTIHVPQSPVLHPKKTGEWGPSRTSPRSAPSGTSMGANPSASNEISIDELMAILLPESISLANLGEFVQS
jgi:hypothetical protein